MELGPLYVDRRGMTAASPTVVLFGLVGWIA
jgi:hypothetical protein